MQVQRIYLPNSEQPTWIVLGNDYLPIKPVIEFITYYENIERSPNTIRSYAHHIKLFWEFLHDSKLQWTDIGLSELAAFVAWLRSPLPLGVTSVVEETAQRSEATVNAILACTGMFYDYHARVDKVKDIPLYRTIPLANRRYKSFLHHINKYYPVKKRLIKLKEPKRLPQTLTPEQVEKLLVACKNRRDNFLLSLLYETGMRVGQALGLRHEDVVSWDNEIKLVPRPNNAPHARAKLCDPATIHVSMELMGLYTDYMVHDFGDIGSDYVFVNLWDGKIGRPMTYNNVAALFRRLSNVTGIKAHPHMFRHTHATEYLRSCGNLRFVQARLNHRSIQSTEIYTHLVNDDLKEAHQKFIATKKSRKK